MALLFDQFNEPYISDFGIAKLADSQANVTGSAIVGTPAYMSPEQAQGEGIDGRSDIYGLGVILFELLSGQQPYHGDTPMSVVVKHITDPVPHILDVMPDLPPDLEFIIEKAMAKDRNERFQDVKSLADALNRVARGEPLSLGPVDSTLVSSAKTSTSKRPVQTLQGTVISKQGQVPGVPPSVPDIPIPAQAAPGSRGRRGVWIGLGVGALFLCVIAVAAVFLLKNNLPFLAGTRPTDTQIVMQASPTPQAGIATPTTDLISQPVATDTPGTLNTPEPSPTQTQPGLASIGGADLIAMLSGNDIWLINVDGSDPRQLTKDAASKHDLQWSPDGQSLFYISGKCVQNVTVPDGVVAQVTCFNAADYLDSFEVSPDGSMVAISINHYLYIVPYDIGALKGATTWIQLKNMKGAIFAYDPTKANQVAMKTVRWSKDSKKIAAVALTPSSGMFLDVVVIYDLTGCTSAAPCNSSIYYKDNFPGQRFGMNGYGTGGDKSPTIPSFAWDGESLFLLNSKIRNNVYGYLYSYNTSNQLGEMLDPLGHSCCYADARWSPDGSYILFTFQDLALGPNSKNQLYFISFGSIGTGTNYAPITLPSSFLTNLQDHPDPILRAVKK